MALAACRRSSAAHSPSQGDRRRGGGPWRPSLPPEVAGGWRRGGADCPPPLAPEVVRGAEEDHYSRVAPLSPPSCHRRRRRYPTVTPRWPTSSLAKESDLHGHVHHRRLGLEVPGFSFVERDEVSEGGLSLELSNGARATTEDQ